MKHHRPGTQYPELRDYEPPKPQRLSPVFRDICGGCVFLAAVSLNVFLILGL